jgi:recombinational DNA repair ATPase RecF
MQLERLKLGDFRNLRDLEVRFTGSVTDSAGATQRLESHALIGPNGSGKSNLIEAIVTIFRDLDLNRELDDLGMTSRIASEPSARSRSWG